MMKKFLFFMKNMRTELAIKNLAQITVTEETQIALAVITA